MPPSAGEEQGQGEPPAELLSSGDIATMDIDIDASRYQQQLQHFAEHCRTFYQASTTTENSGDHVDSAVSLSVARAVLAEFDFICQSEASSYYHKQYDGNSSHWNAIRECGLNDLSCFRNDDKGQNLLLAYTKVRDRERGSVHAKQMRARQDALLQLLRKCESDRGIVGGSASVTTGSELEGKKKRQEWVQRARPRVRHFVAEYRSRLGAHPFLAGIRALLEAQLNRSQLCWWTFDSAVLTDNCRAGVELSNDPYVKDAMLLLTSLFVSGGVTSAALEIDLEVNRASMCKEWQENLSTGTVGETSCAAMMLCFRAHEEASDGQLRRILRLLPRKDVLHGRPTGSIEYSTNGEDRLNMKADNSCLSRVLGDPLCNDNCNVS